MNYVFLSKQFLVNPEEVVAFCPVEMLDEYTKKRAKDLTNNHARCAAFMRNGEVFLIDKRFSTLRNKFEILGGGEDD